MANIINSIISGGGGGTYPYGLEQELIGSDKTVYKFSDLRSSFPTSTSSTNLQAVQRKSIPINFDRNKYALRTVTKVFTQYAFLPNTSLTVGMPIATMAISYPNVCSKSYRNNRGTVLNYSTFINPSEVDFFERYFADYATIERLHIYVGSGGTILTTNNNYGVIPQWSNTTYPNFSSDQYNNILYIPQLTAMCHNTYCLPSTVQYIDIDKTIITIETEYYRVKIDSYTGADTTYKTLVDYGRTMLDTSLIPQ